MAVHEPHREPFINQDERSLHFLQRHQHQLLTLEYQFIKVELLSLFAGKSMTQLENI